MMTTYAKFCEQKIQGNGGCCVTGKSVSMADLLLWGTVKSVRSGMFDHIDKDFFDQFPGIR